MLELSTFEPVLSRERNLLMDSHHEMRMGVVFTDFISIEHDTIIFTN